MLARFPDSIKVLKEVRAELSNPPFYLVGDILFGANRTSFMYDELFTDGDLVLNKDLQAQRRSDERADIMEYICNKIYVWLGYVNEQQCVRNGMENALMKGLRKVTPPRQP